jgi:tetraacyldisaccharide 4'-kinase
MQNLSTTKSSQLSVSIQESWYNAAIWLQILRPVSWLFRIVVFVRRQLYLKKRATHVSNIPIIVVGNISVGGAGKTPLLMALAAELKRRGHRVGIVSRGYGGNTKHYPLLVSNKTVVAESGDEPAMLAQRLDLPVVVDPQRVRAIQFLSDSHEYHCDVILSDDGLQHYAMPRDIEILVVDAERGFGNGLCLPAGPLREPLSRLHSVDFLVANGIDVMHKLPKRHSFTCMTLKPSACVHVSTGERVNVDTFFRRQLVHAVAGIGNPQRFFQALKDLGLQVIEHPFPDHYIYIPKDLDFGDALPVLMTEKDAVKCKNIPLRNAWYLEVNAVLPDSFYALVVERLTALQVARKIGVQRSLFDQ